MTQVFLNGDFKPLNEAKISVLDRGFMFGDGVYEVIPVFNHKIFRFKEHLERLNNSLRAIYMENPFSKKEWLSIFVQLIDKIGEENQSIYVQITRGISERDHNIGLTDKPTIFVMSRPLPKKNLSNGIKAVTHEDIRWSNCHIKAITLLPSVLLRHRAKLQDAKEAILIKNNYVTEGAASNVFLLKDNIVYTSPKNNAVLPGITRDLILELLKKEHIEYKEEPIKETLLYIADEVWLTSSTWEIVPVIKINDKLVADGKVGSTWNRVNKLYQFYKNNYCN